MFSQNLHSVVCGLNDDCALRVGMVLFHVEDFDPGGTIVFT